MCLLFAQAWTWLREHSPWAPIVISAVYLAFCYFGQKVMANRKPFNLKYSLVTWNFLLAAFSFVGAVRWGNISFYMYFGVREASLRQLCSLGFLWPLRRFCYNFVLDYVSMSSFFTIFQVILYIRHTLVSHCPSGRTVPHLLNILYIYGFKYTICYKPSVWYGSGAVGLWTQAFIFSKVKQKLSNTAIIDYCW